jgi:acyl-CoA thioester hydrolase
MPIIFESHFEVKVNDIDGLNHVNNARYLQWVQDISEAHWISVANKEWLEKYAWVALNHFIEYKKPAFLGNKIHMMTHVEASEGVKCNRLVRIFNSETKELLAQSSSWWCLIDPKTMKPLRITEEIKATF